MVLKDALEGVLFVAFFLTLFFVIVFFITHLFYFDFEMNRNFSFFFFLLPSLYIVYFNK